MHRPPFDRVSRANALTLPFNFGIGAPVGVLLVGKHVLVEVPGSDKNKGSTLATGTVLGLSSESCRC